MVRSNQTYGEEELYYSGKVAVHCKGNQNTRILEATYTCETDIKHALWCIFHTSIPDHLTKGKEYEAEGSIHKSLECICLLDSYTLKVFTECGEDYVSTLQFQVKTENFFFNKTLIDSMILYFFTFENSHRYEYQKMYNIKIQVQLNFIEDKKLILFNKTIAYIYFFRK